MADTEDYATDPSTHPIFTEDDLGPLLDVDGTAAVLSSPCGGGYYHWLVDVLPRLEVLKRAGHETQAMDRVIVNACSASYQRETLSAAGVEQSKIIESRWHPHVRADRLVCPTLPGAFGHVPRWACDFLRQMFLPEDDTGGPGERLYLNRTHVTHRHVENEPDLIRRLERRGFRNVTLDSLSVGEQARLLSTARIVVAPHGAGLTNILFCHPGTWIVELMSPSDVSHVYWALAETMDLDYTYVLGEGEPSPVGIDPHDGELDLRVSLDAVDRTLDAVEGELKTLDHIGPATGIEASQLGWREIA